MSKSNTCIVIKVPTEDCLLLSGILQHAITQGEISLADGKWDDREINETRATIAKLKVYAKLIMSGGDVPF